MTETAWTDLHGRLRGFVGRRVRDPDAADDIAQEVLLRLHRNFTALRDQERLDAFAYQIARNAIIDHYRGRARSRENLVTPEDLAGHLDQPEFDDGDGDLAALQDLARCLKPLLNQLSEPSRTALLLTDLGDVCKLKRPALPESRHRV